MTTLRFLLGLSAPVRRGPYLFWGLGLGALKLGLDTAVVWACAHLLWSPLGYVVPSMVLRSTAVGPAPEATYMLLAAVALPFLWVGVSMSVRRAADAGMSPWAGTVFLVPILNYVVIAALCALPSSGDGQRPSGTSVRPALASASSASPARTTAALRAVLSSILIGLPMIAISVYGLGSYGSVLFLMTPFAMGAASAAVYNRDVPQTVRSTLGIAALGVLFTGAATLLFAIEGLFCLVMAAPIAIVIGAFGALVGRALVTGGHRGLHAPALVLLLPGIAFGEAHIAAPTARAVTTSVEIDAPPERVWPNVIGFSDLTEPPSWVFRLGIAYPVRAHISGEGVGAVRRCEFSTGAFVEPITTWSPPTRLAFDVTSQPPSMTEWSPYGAIHAPHLDGYMTSRGGEFDLQALPGGRTRLTGTTHYTLAIYPETYWVPYAEALLHAIHGRVLRHIKALSETERPR